uniref:Uncharacterized protein n=1 Tax=Glossina palpalis gambiensis TaxID=67801 RepID=A0A1B0BTV9_9MUSC
MENIAYIYVFVNFNRFNLMFPYLLPVVKVKFGEIRTQFRLFDRIDLLCPAQDARGLRKGQPACTTTHMIGRL